MRGVGVHCNQDPVYKRPDGIAFNEQQEREDQDERRESDKQGDEQEHEYQDALLQIGKRCKQQPKRFPVCVCGCDVRFGPGFGLRMT